MLVASATNSTTYLDDNADGLLAVSLDDTDPDHPIVQIDETVFRTPLRTSHTDYDSVGNPSASTDQFGDVGGVF